MGHDGVKAKHVFLVGGFGESPYLQKLIKSTAARMGSSVVSCEEPAKKAVAEGAGIWLTKNTVTARAATRYYGSVAAIVFDNSSDEHKSRNSIKYQDRQGKWMLDNSFKTMVKKNERIKVDEMTKHNLYRIVEDSRDLTQFQGTLWVFDGDGAPPDFSTNPNRGEVTGFRRLIKMTADLSRLKSSLEERKNVCGDVSCPNNGRPCYYHDYGKHFYVPFSVGLSLGSTSIKGAIFWSQDGVEMTGPISIVPLNPRK